MTMEQAIRKWDGDVFHGHEPEAWADLRLRALEQDAALANAQADHNGALLRERRLSAEVAGWKQELRDLADAIPTDNSAGDSELMRAVAQAHLVLQEGLQ